MELGEVPSNLENLVKEQAKAQKEIQLLTGLSDCFRVKNSKTHTVLWMGRLKTKELLTVLSVASFSDFFLNLPIVHQSDGQFLPPEQECSSIF
jgi:hypothetical protein